MPRLEKNLYERFFNTKTLGRAREIMFPKKKDTISITNTVMIQQYQNIQKLSWVDCSSRFLISTISIFNIHFERGILQQRGYSFEDVEVHSENELRRSPYHEHIWRESTHPYHHLFFKARRRRYFKVDRIISGFFVPDYVKDEVKNVTLGSAYKKKLEYENFVYHNYTSDETTTTHMGTVNYFFISKFIYLINLE